jgi:hypothetical protein
MKTIDDPAVTGRRVVVRASLNVPLHGQYDAPPAEHLGGEAAARVSQ